jgi:hypothetical protein
MIRSIYPYPCRSLHSLSHLWNSSTRKRLSIAANSPTLKVKDGSAVSMTFRYFPNEKAWPKQMVEIAKTFKDD